MPNIYFYVFRDDLNYSGKTTCFKKNLSSNALNFICLIIGINMIMFSKTTAYPKPSANTFLLHFFSSLYLHLYLIISFLYLSGVRHRWPRGRGEHPPTLIPRGTFTQNFCLGILGWRNGDDILLPPSCCHEPELSLPHTSFTLI